MYKKIINTASDIATRLGIKTTPEVAIILGSGLGSIVDRIDVESSLEYSQIKDFPQSTVVGHSGKFIYGRLAGRWVIAMQGRVHYYEGYSMDQVTLPVRVLCTLGVKILIVSNAAGGVNPTFSVGDIMVIDDQINLLPNPLIGPNDDRFGTRFPDMGNAYDYDLRALADQIATGQGINIRHGVYLGSTGPSYETRAEYSFFHAIGADACGMSTTPEVIVARHQGVRVFGLSLISNMGLGSQAGINSHQEVFEAAQKATGRMSDLVEELVKNL